MTNTPPEERDFNNQDILYSGEAPEQIIGFSQYDHPEHGYCNYAFREAIAPDADIRAEVKKMIDLLRPDVSGFGVLEDEDPATILAALEAEVERRKASDGFGESLAGSGEPVEYCINGITQAEPPVFPITNPTLFIYSTNYEFVQFRDQCIIPKYPSKILDPYCSKMRLWNNRTVLGWYSSYSVDGPKLEADVEDVYWYNLVIDGLVRDSNGNIQRSLDFTTLMDPGGDPRKVAVGNGYPSAIR